MTLDEAIRHAEEVASRKFDDRVHCIKCAEEHKQLAEWLKDYKRLLEQTQWISCSEKLPEENYAVLVWCPERKNNYCAYLAEGQWWIFGAYSAKVQSEVKAWQPLPEPYKAERSEEWKIEQ